ncbi:MAG: ATP-dependent 6-phosphofructokinase [Desulfohalobiaceae bacterium]|nr:ATP-dependent 6-phosphofructokinase [Desulfohalobiaceae bacterium]MCF8106981.1 ATP-dependent 6-phosphofructokinase [Desulfohalobiaceae bacterium]
MSSSQAIATEIDVLGPARIPSPLPMQKFVNDQDKLIMHISPETAEDFPLEGETYDFEEAGPREKIYFDPRKTKCAVVTCGGLCPGTNDVIRAIVMEAHFQYSMPSTLGIRFGLQGFIPEFGHDIMELTPESVARSHEFGGTILGSSRGHQRVDEIVEALDRMNISILFLIGGDGTMKAASSINEQIKKRNLKISIVCIPKTIDNDIHFVSKSFGFDTAVAKATEAIRCAHTEAMGAPYGIGMVKLMGRQAGFIAVEATLAMRDVNFVLVPEAPFCLEGPDGFLNSLKERVMRRGHAVVVVAEGAGQELCRWERQQNGQQEVDLSGNPILEDITGLLQRKIKEYFLAEGVEITLKFIDPSYIIRSVPANSGDRVYCGFLGQHAVHAAMAGKTDLVVSRLNDRYVYLPLDLVTRKRRTLNINSNYWRAVLASTGQPVNLCSKSNSVQMEGLET